MIDITAITSALSSVKTATDIAKLLTNSDLSLEKAELKLKLAELVSALADAKIQIAEIQELLTEKENKIKELDESFQTKDTLVQKWDAYYKVDGGGNPTGKPYCMHCWEVKHKTFHLHDEAGNSRVRACPSCNTKYRRNMAPLMSSEDKQDE